MKEPKWVLSETVQLLHEQLLADYGGSAGIRDAGLLDSALSRPQKLFFYGSPTMFELATGYAFGIVKNHPFIDGNKRTGFTVAVLFLELNGCRFQASEADAAVQTLALAAGAIGEDEFVVWLDTNSWKL